MKITLLATGFGLNGITNAIEPQEQTPTHTPTNDEDFDEMIGVYYTASDKKHNHERHNIFIYSEENIDNDDIISQVDATPTKSRTKEDLKRLKGKLDA